MKMKALVKREAGEGLSLEERDVPEPAEGQVLLKVRAASICGTDVHIYRWDEWARTSLRLPRTIGHEFAGEVVAVGPGVEGVSEGEFASVESHIPCGECDLCRSDQMHICTRQEIFGIHRDGGFAEYVAVPAICLWRHRKPIEPERAAIMEPLGNAVHATSAAPVQGRSCVVFGCGPAGLFTVMVAKALGADRIVAADPDPERRGLAEEVGADEVFDPGNAAAAEVRGGFDIVFEMSGAQSALDHGIRMLRNGGTFVAFGLPGGAVRLSDVILSGRRIVGVIGRHMFETWKRMQRLLDEGRIDPERIITHRFPLSAFEAAFRTILERKGRTGKVVLLP